MEENSRRALVVKRQRCTKGTKNVGSMPGRLLVSACRRPMARFGHAYRNRYDRRQGPRTVGAQMAVTESGLAQGYLTGGGLEAELVLRGKQVIGEGSNVLERYGKGSRFFDLRLPCGSAIDI